MQLTQRDVRSVATLPTRCGARATIPTRTSRRRWMSPAERRRDGGDWPSTIPAGSRPVLRPGLGPTPAAGWFGMRSAAPSQIRPATARTTIASPYDRSERPDTRTVPAVAVPRDAPEDVVEQQLVVVRRREPLQAEVRPVHHHLAQPADLRVHTELAHDTSSLALAAASGTTDVPALPSTIRSMSSSDPMAARFPVASTKRMAASTFGPIEPTANGCSRNSPGLTRSSRRWSGVPQPA